MACGDGPATPPQLPTAVKLGFMTQPGTTEGQVEFTPSIRVAVQDQAGNTVTSDAHAVTLDVTNATLDVDVSAEEMARRAEGFVPPEGKYARGVLAKYRKLVGSASKGAVCD